MIPRRDELVVTVGAPADWSVTAELLGGPLVPGRSVEVRVRVGRKGGADRTRRSSRSWTCPGCRSSACRRCRREPRNHRGAETAPRRPAPGGDVQFVLVSGLNEFVGVHSNTMNWASAPARVRVAWGEK